jgi:hypothetical protein
MIACLSSGIVALIAICGTITLISISIVIGVAYVAAKRGYEFSDETHSH